MLYYNIYILLYKYCNLVYLHLFTFSCRPDERLRFLVTEAVNVQSILAMLLCILDTETFLPLCHYFFFPSHTPWEIETCISCWIERNLIVLNIFWLIWNHTRISFNLTRNRNASPPLVWEASSETGWKYYFDRLIQK